MYKKTISIITSLFILIFNILCNINIKSYTPEEQITILNNIEKKLIPEQNRILFKNIKTTQSVYMIGDLHGDLESFEFIKKIIHDNISGGEINDLFVFLGDYVDHGKNSVEVFMGLAELKIKYPENIILLAGNHERFCDQIDMISYAYTLKSQVNNNQKLLNKYYEIFKLLPLGVVLKLHDDKKIFCVHGGLPTTNHGTLRTQFIEYVNHIYDQSKQDLGEQNSGLPHDIIFQLLWNDPQILGVPEHKKYYVHDSKIAQEYMQKLGWDYIFRGHQYVKTGFRQDFSGINEFTVFSSCNYDKGSDSNAAIVQILPEHQEYKVTMFNYKETKNSKLENL